MRSLLKEPLIHFLGGALLVFGFFWATGTDRDPTDYAITISDADIARMKAGWEQSFRRPPSQQELDSLIDQEITEEIYYREALRLGLDKNDPVIRRRMFTKMRFLDNEEMASESPSDSELREWMSENSGKYALPPSYDLQQIYLGQAGPTDPSKVEEMIGQLSRETKKPADFNIPISLPGKLVAADASVINRQFGEQFTKALEELEPGKWTGPVTSGFGQHLVRIERKIPGKAAALDDVRQAVLNDWTATKTQEQEKAALKRYRSQYTIEVAGRE